MDSAERNIIAGLLMLGAIIAIPYAWLTRQDVRFSSPVTYYLLHQDDDTIVEIPEKFFEEKLTKREILSLMLKQKYFDKQRYKPSYKRTFCEEKDAECVFLRKTRYGIATCNTFVVIKFDDANLFASARGYTTSCYW